MILFWKLHWPKGRTAVSLVGFNLLYFKKKKQGCRKKLQGHGPLSWLGVAWLGMTVNFVISSVGGMAKSKKHSNRAHGTGHCTIDDYWFDIDNDHFWPLRTTSLLKFVCLDKINESWQSVATQLMCFGSSTLTMTKAWGSHLSQRKKVKAC